MPILVTGGAGFIGSHFVEYLLPRTNEPIVCVDNFNDYYDPTRKRQNIAGFKDHPNVTMETVDFSVAEQIRPVFEKYDFQSVMHLGAYAGVRRSVETPAIYVRNNVEGTLNLLECSRRTSIQRFVLVSSSTVYGRGAQVPFREDARLGIPASPYGATKRAAELLGRTYFELHNTPVVCVRPFSVYGPRLRPDLALSIFAEKILTGQEIPLYGDGSYRRDFTHVTDICAGLYAALTNTGLDGQSINLGHSEPIAIGKVIEMLETALDKKARIKLMPVRPEDLPITHANLERAKNLLDFRPKIAFADGIVEFAKWYASWSQAAS